MAHGGESKSDAEDINDNITGASKNNTSIGKSNRPQVDILNEKKGEEKESGT
jgi:hypothetical protein